MKLVTVQVFGSLAMAYIAKSRLEAEGLTCFIQNENLGSLFAGVTSILPVLSKKEHGVLLQVPEDSIKMAREILGLSDDFTQSQ